jgi:hypothetical protein
MIVDNPNLVSADKKILACNKKGQYVVEHFLMSRYFHYSQIIYHKTNAAFEGLTKVIYTKLLHEKAFSYNSLKDIKDSVNNLDFIDFNDANLEVAMKQFNEKTVDPDFKLLYKMYSKRIRPKTVFNIKDMYSTSPRPQFSTLKWTLKRNPEVITEIVGSEKWGYQIVPLTIEKIRGEYSWDEAMNVESESLREAIRMYDIEDGKLNYLAVDKLSIINKLSNNKSEFIRIYVLDEMEDEKYKEIKQKIEALIQS